MERAGPRFLTLTGKLKHRELERAKVNPQWGAGGELKDKAAK